MSLIADALKRAQEQRAQGGEGKDPDAKARRLLRGSGPLRVETKEGISVPPSVAIAGTVLLAAVVTFGGVVWLTPRAEGAGGVIDPGLRASTPVGPRETAQDPVDARPTASDPGGAAVRVAGGQPPDATAMDGLGETGARPRPDAARADVPRDATAPEADPSGALAAAGPGGDPGTERAAEGGEGAEPAGEPSSFRLTIQGQAAAVPMDASELFGRAISAQQRGDLRGAASLYRRAIERNPTDAQLHNNLGTVYRALSMPGEAMAAFRAAVDVDPSYAPAWSNLGIMLDGAGRTEEAIEAFREALRRDPSNDGARVNLANKYIGMGLVDDARVLLRDVLRDSPALPEAHYAMARAMETAGETEDAARHYRVFLDLASGRFPRLEARVEGHLGELEGGGE